MPMNKKYMCTCSYTHTHMNMYIYFKAEIILPSTAAQELWKNA